MHSNQALKETLGRIAVEEPNGVVNELRRESATFVGDRLRIIRRALLTCQYLEIV